MSVSILAGELGGRGQADGPANEARFSYPRWLATDPRGGVYVFDLSTLRNVAEDGAVPEVRPPQ